MPRWLEHFESIGGTLVIGEATVDDLEAYADAHDLVIVAGGRGEIASLFERDGERSRFDRPMRALALTYVTGMTPRSDFSTVSFNLIPGVGEYFVLPALTTTGPCEIMVFEGVPGGPMDCWNGVRTPEEHLAKSKWILETFVPWEAERCAEVELTDPNGTLTGRFPPTVRKPVGVLPSGRAVLGMGDVVVLNDPITGQGSNNAAKCAASYLASIRSRDGRPFDATWTTSGGSWSPRRRTATSPSSPPLSIASVGSPNSLEFYDAELRAHHERLRAAYGISPGDEVVDIGCGAGLTTREAARAAAPGRVVGVDVSERMLERARQLTAAERLDDVRYELGDAQVHRFDPAGFDVAISRFGTMFFSDPAAAFANIAAALRPEARLVLLVWQRHEDNEWARAIDAALGDAARPPQPGADPFSLGDAEVTAGILEGAGFDGIRFEDVHEPVFYGHDLDAALAIVRGFQDTSAALASLTDGAAARTVERLREMLAAHYSDERGVALASRSWLITARRRRAH